MRGFRVAAATVGLSAALTGTAVGLAGPASAVCEGGYPAQQCTLAIDDSRVVPGEPLAFSGSRYTPEETAIATVYSTPVRVGTFTADAAGVVSGTITVPDVAPGRHTLEVAGTTSGVIRRVSFVVVPNQAAAGDGDNGNRGGNSENSALAFTGTDAGTMAGLGGALLVGGGALIAAARRRKAVSAAL